MKIWEERLSGIKTKETSILSVKEGVKYQEESCPGVAGRTGEKRRRIESRTLEAVFKNKEGTSFERIGISRKEFFRYPNSRRHSLFEKRTKSKEWETKLFIFASE